MAGVGQKWQERTDQRNMVAAGNASAISNLVKRSLGLSAGPDADPSRILKSFWTTSSFTESMIVRIVLE
jgi:hypothetical protein